MSDQAQSPAGEQATRQLAAQALVQLGGLAGQEFALAKAEFQAHARHLGMGSTMLATGGLLGGTAWLVLVGAAIAGIAAALPVWAAALIVGGALGLLAGAIAAVGGRRIGRAMPPMPMTTESLRRDLAEIREKAWR